MDVHVRKGALALGELTDGIEVPTLVAPDLDVLASPKTGGKDLFAEKKRAAWKGVQVDEARCEVVSPVNRLRSAKLKRAWLCSRWHDWSRRTE